MPSYFPLALTQQLITIRYFSLSDKNPGMIVTLQFEPIKRHVEARYEIPFD